PPPGPGCMTGPGRQCRVGRGLTPVRVSYRPHVHRPSGAAGGAEVASVLSAALEAARAGVRMWVINVLDLVSDDMVAPRGALAADPDPGTAARGRMLLDLVEYLHARGSAPQVCGMLVSVQELMVYPAVPDPRSVWVEVSGPDCGPAAGRLPG